MLVLRAFGREKCKGLNKKIIGFLDRYSDNGGFGILSDKLRNRVIAIMYTVVVLVVIGFVILLYVYLSGSGAESMYNNLSLFSFVMAGLSPPGSIPWITLGFNFQSASTDTAIQTARIIGYLFAFITFVGGLLVGAYLVAVAAK